MFEWPQRIRKFILVRFNELFSTAYVVTQPKSVNIKATQIVIAVHVKKYKRQGHENNRTKFEELQAQSM